MHNPFVYPADLIVPAHLFGIYAPGTTPDPPGCSTLPYHAADVDKQEDLMPAETGDEALEAELCVEALLDAADARARPQRTRLACGASSARAVGRALRVVALRGERGSGARERTWMGMVRTLCVCGSGGKACLELEATCQCRLLRLRNRMVSGEERGDDRGLGLVDVISI
jgi:hypothetical protein